MNRQLTHSLKESEIIAKKLLDYIVSSKKIGKATIVGFSGDLGSGKTTFSQIIAKELGISEKVTSPTFVIEKRYPVKSTGYSTVYSQLIHIDVYRLESGHELSKIGFSEISQDEKNLIIIEWPEKVADILPEDMIQVRFEWVDDKSRAISF